MTTRAAFSVAPISSTARKTNASSFAPSMATGCSTVAMISPFARDASTVGTARFHRIRWAPSLRQMLLGRDRERAELTRALAGAREGRSSVLALVGEPGIGKSALLAEAETAARVTSMRVLSARGIESEAHVPFAGLLELLRPALGALDRIPPRQANALGGALALRSAGRHDRFAVGAATLSLLAASAEDAPLLVLVDDAHWLDRSSAEALLFATRR